MVRSAALADLKSMKKNDVILLAALVVAAFAAFAGISWYSHISTREPQAVVFLDGEEQGRYPLSEDITVELCQDDGSYNILQIQGGKAEITQASCPDKICVRHRPVSGQGESLVCLPNKMVVEIENGEESGVDAGTR